MLCNGYYLSISSFLFLLFFGLFYFRTMKYPTVKHPNRIYVCIENVLKLLTLIKKLIPFFCCVCFVCAILLCVLTKTI